MHYLEIERALARHYHLEQKSQYTTAPLSDELRLSMWTAPAYRFNNNGTVSFSCDCFTYHIYAERDEYRCQIEINRAETKVSQNDPATLIDLNVIPIQVMKPWNYEKGENPINPINKQLSYPELPQRQQGSAEHIAEIRNLQNMIFEHRLHNIQGLFSCSREGRIKIDTLNIDSTTQNAIEQINGILETERENNHCYLFLGVSCMPIIEVSPDNTLANGLFTAMCYSVDGKKLVLKRSFAIINSDYIMEDGSWKIHNMEIRELVKLPNMPYGNTGRYDLCGQSDKPWPMEQSGTLPPEPSDAMAIENIINGWAYGCRRGTLIEFMEKHIANSQGKCKMWIKSRGEDTPKQENYLQISEKLNDLTSHYREEFYTFHAPTTPILNLLPDGSIMGTWFDCAATNLRSAAKSLTAVPYMCFVNKYAHRFEKIDGEWKMTSFKNEPVISLPDWELDMENNKGYLINSHDRRFPPAFSQEE